MGKITQLRTLLLPLIVAASLPLFAPAPSPPVPAEPVPLLTLATRLPDSPVRYVSEDIPLPSPAVRPRITNLNITQIDDDPEPEVLICDAVRHTVYVAERTKNGSWESRALVPENSLAAPAHTTVVDIDQDGDADILVAILRSVWPSDERTGQVVLLRNNNSQWAAEVLADDLRRITDIQAADFDEDGDLDLAVAEFGYQHGRVLWLEQKEDGRIFADHALSSLPGCIHVPVGDYDGDGDPDIAALISQNSEEVIIFENEDGPGFTGTLRRIWTTPDFDRGLAGMVACDLDQDGDEDFLLSAGDNLELSYPCPQPRHGCLWLENQGAMNFAVHELGRLGGTYAAGIGDFDHDGDQDVALVSMFNDWKQPNSTSVAWLENDGKMNFKAWHVADAPTHLCTVACGDVTGDGIPDILAGSLQIYPPYTSDAAGIVLLSVSGDNQ